MNDKISICIPRVNKNIEKSDILGIFNQYNWGIINNIDLIHVKNYIFHLMFQLPNNIYLYHL